MKGNPKVITALNGALAHELININQYIVHAEMCANWGYEKLDSYIMKRAIDEMKHVEKLIARILFLEGQPIVTNPIKVDIGTDVAKMMKNDHLREEEAIKIYNESIKLCNDLGDHSTCELLGDILEDEISHIDVIEEYQAQIEQMTLPLFLTTQNS